MTIGMVLSIGLQFAWSCKLVRFAFDFVRFQNHSGNSQAGFAWGLDVHRRGGTSIHACVCDVYFLRLPFFLCNL